MDTDMNNPLISSIKIPVVSISSLRYALFSQLFWAVSAQLNVSLSNEGQSSTDAGDFSTSANSFRSMFFAILLIPGIWIFILVVYWARRVWSFVIEIFIIEILGVFKSTSSAENITSNASIFI